MLHICEARLWQMQNICVFVMSEGQGIATFKAHGGERMFKHSNMKGKIDHCIYGLPSRSNIPPKKCHWCHYLQAWGANWCSCCWTQYFCWQKNLRWCWIRIQRSCRWSEERCSRRPGSLHEHKTVSECRDTVGLGGLWGQAKSGKPQQVLAWRIRRWTVGIPTLQFSGLSFTDIIHSLSTAWTRNFRFASHICFQLLSIPPSLFSL